MALKALFLAAGLGTRLKPLTDIWPKCLMPIRRVPLLEYWLVTAKELRVVEVLVNIHAHAEHVQKFLSLKDLLGWVNWVHEPILLGTAGTLRKNASFFRGNRVLLVHSDNWCHCDFGDFIDYHFNRRPKHCLITMMTFSTDSPQSCGIVETDDAGVVTAFHEKVSNPPGNRANAAIYLLEPQVLEWLESQTKITDFSTEVLPRYVGRISTWHNSGIHRDIGILSELRAAQTDLVPPHLVLGKDQWQRDFESSAIFNDLVRYIEPQELPNDR